MNRQAVLAGVNSLKTPTELSYRLIAGQRLKKSRSSKRLIGMNSLRNVENPEKATR